MKNLFLTILLLSVFGLSAYAEENANLLKPTNNLESWRVETHEEGKGTAKVEDDTIVFSTEKTTGTNWHFQAFQVDLDLKNGKEYVLTFEAKGEGGQAVGISAMIDQEDWHSIGVAEEIYLGKEFKKYEYKFTATETAPKKNRVGFTLGNDKGNVSIKNMSLIER